MMLEKDTVLNKLTTLTKNEYEIISWFEPNLIVIRFSTWNRIKADSEFNPDMPIFGNNLEKPIFLKVILFL